MKLLQSSIYALIFSAIALTARGQVALSEIMQSNIDCVFDELNDFPDSWVEIYYSGDTATPLNVYSIGLSDNPDEAWQLPDVKIYPNTYRLIFCDKEATGMHTNFRLESGKDGCVYLFKDKVVIDKLENLPKQPAPNIAYGRQNLSSDVWGYQSEPTPGKQNTGVLCTEVLGEPVFSIPGGVYANSQTIQVELSLPEDAPEGTKIRYTTDGSEPTVNSTLYKRAFSSSTNLVIRAKLFCDGYLSRPSTTHSYIIHSREVTLPVVSIATTNSYFYDNKKGIYVEGTYSSDKKNYQYNWRRPVNIEYFEGAGQESAINQLGEARCAGAASRGFALKSLVVYAHKRFGKKQLKYEFFPDERLGQKDFKSIVLRNAGNDFDYLYMRDAIIQRTFASHVDIDHQAWRPAIFYLNGKYMGMLNIRERGNEDNIYTNYDHLEDIDLFENLGNLKEGDWENYNAFRNFYNEHGHTLDEYRQYLDIEEYINYMGMNMYFDNVDFPANNLMFWRPRTDEGRWRFIAKDTDYALGIYGRQYNFKYFNWFYDNSYDSSIAWGNTSDGTRLFRRLMEDNDFKTLFLDRMAIYMGSFLRYDHVWKEVWEPMYNLIKTEYPYHREPINRWWPNYNDELRTAQSWLKNRTTFFYQHMADYFKTGTMAAFVVNNNITDEERNAVLFSFNDINLCGGDFNGKYFPGHEVRLKGIPFEDGEKVVTSWSVLRVESDGKTVNDNVKGDEYCVTMPQCTRLQVNAVLGSREDNAIEEISDEAFGLDQAVEIYDINGIRHTTLQPGINIVKLRNGHVRKVRF